MLKVRGSKASRRLLRERMQPLKGCIGYNIRVILGLYWGYIGIMLSWGYIGIMLYWGYIGIIGLYWGLYWDNGKENGNYYNGESNGKENGK